MNEGEVKKKKIYKQGDIVTFRLLKKQRIGEEVLELLNLANENHSLNIEIINALKLYAKYRLFLDNKFDNEEYNEKEFFDMVQAPEQKSNVTFDTSNDTTYDTYDTVKALMTPINDTDSTIMTPSFDTQRGKNLSSNDTDWLEDEVAADEIFSTGTHENEEKNNLKRHFKGFRRNI